MLDPFDIGGVVFFAQLFEDVPLLQVRELHSVVTVVVLVMADSDDVCTVEMVRVGHVMQQRAHACLVEKLELLADVGCL